MPAAFSDQNAAARLNGLLDSAMDAIISVDESQRIVLYNRAAEKIFGWPAAQALGQRLETLIPARFRAGHDDRVARFGRTGVTSRRMGGANVVWGLAQDGREFPAEASISHLDTPEGKLYTVILRDVTEREQARQELASFAADASSVREQEKSRVARELHDELAQSLTALKMDTNWLRLNLRADPAAAAARLEEMLAMLDTAVASTRRIAADLRPLVLDDLGLVPAIEWLAQTFTQRTGVPCDLDVDESIDLPEPYASGVFRIVQESLANVGKHAQAKRALVRLVRQSSDLMLTVRDDGVGFAPQAPRKPQSLGLAGLRERAHLLRGEVTVNSTPGEGTTVEARIPQPEEKAA